MVAPDLSLVITAYNESAIIINNIDELASWMAEHCADTSFEIVVVDDGSTDAMGALLDDACNQRNWLKVAHHPINFGRGRGVRTGFAVSSGSYIICLDADLSYSPEHIPKLLEPLKAGEADITLASVYHPEGKVINVPRQRILLSKWGNKILSLGFGGSFSTVTCIVRGYTRALVDSLELVSDGKELHLEVIQKALLLGCRVKEIPATLHWRDRKRGQVKKRRFFPEIALFKMRKTVVSHLVFNYISNPGILLLIPILILFSTIVLGGAMLLISFFRNLSALDFSLLQIIRQTLLEGQLTFIVVSFAIIFLMIFLGFYFLSFQNKRYFDEVYTIVMRMNSRIKKIESSSNHEMEN
jgi:glycosyltransferase involved in cell wall biosynthesis